MKKFLYRIAKLSIPFWVILALIVLLDPFGFLWRTNETQNLLLTEISKNNDRPLFNLLQLNKKNPEIIVIGDSRSDQLNLDNCQNKKQENKSLNVNDYLNLSDVENPKQMYYIIVISFLLFIGVMSTLTARKVISPINIVIYLLYCVGFMSLVHYSE